MERPITVGDGFRFAFGAWLCTVLIAALLAILFVGVLGGALGSADLLGPSPEARKILDSGQSGH